MAAADKCCAICGEYQDLRFASDGALYGELYEQRPTADTYRFKVANVCRECVRSKPLSGADKNQLSFESGRPYTDRILNKKKSLHWIDVEDKILLKSLPKWRVDDEPVKLGKAVPSLYYVSHRLMVGMVYDRSKKKLRRALRMLGVKGDVARLVR